MVCDACSQTVEHLITVTSHPDWHDGLYCQACVDKTPRTEPESYEVEEEHNRCKGELDESERPKTESAQSTEDYGQETQSAEKEP